MRLRRSLLLHLGCRYPFFYAVATLSTTVVSFLGTFLEAVCENDAHETDTRACVLRGPHCSNAPLHIAHMGQLIPCSRVQKKSGGTFTPWLHESTLCFKSFAGRVS
jgi:hypothetical protein